MKNQLIGAIKNNLFTIIVLGLIVFWGGFLRFYHLGEQTLWIDEGFTINASQAILEHGYPLMDSGVSYPFHILHNYLTALSMQIFDFDPLNPWSARFPAALFGTLSILAVFIFTKKLTKNTLVALTASALMAFSYWEISWSRQARGYIDMQFFALLSFIFFYDWLETKQIKKLLWTTFLFLMSFLSFNVALVFVPTFGLIYAINFLWSKKYKAFILSMIALSVICIALFFIMKNTVTLAQRNYFYIIIKYFKLITFSNIEYIAIATMAIVPGIFFGKNHIKNSVFLISIISISFLGIVYFIPLQHMRYLLTIFPFMLIAISYSIYIVVEKNEYLKPIFRKIIYLIIISSISFTSMTFMPSPTYRLEFGSPQANFKNGYKVISELKKQDDITISAFPALSKIYLGDRGLWIPISLTGLSEEIDNIRGDYYTGAPVISDNDALRQILDTKHGYIILDLMAERRLGDNLHTILNHPRTFKVYFEETPKTLQTIAVYGFGVERIKIPVYK